MTGFTREDQRRRLHAVLALCAVLILGAGCSPAVPQLPLLAPDAVILSFGDSITYGTGAAPEESYPAVLERLTGRRVINAGVPGELSGAGLKRLPKLLDEHAPALLILCHGGNDLLRKRDPQEIAANLRAMIHLAREKGTTVVLLGVPEPGLFLKSARLYGDIAEEYSLLFLANALPNIEADAKLKSDPIHPNGKGYDKLARTIYALLRASGAVGAAPVSAQ